MEKTSAKAARKAIEQSGLADAPPTITFQEDEEDQAPTPFWLKRLKEVWSSFTEQFTNY